MQPATARPTGANALEQGAALVAKNEFGRALPLLLQSAAAQPDRSDIWQLLSRVQLQLGDSTGAATSASRAVSLAPGVADNHYLLGRARRAVAGPGAAVPHFQKALELNPTDVPTWVSLGVALKADGKPAGAAMAYRRALALEPDCRPARFNLAGIPVNDSLAPPDSGAAAEVEECLRLGDAAAGRKEFREAMLHYGRAAELAPGAAPIQYRMGAVLWDQGNLEDALVHFDLAARLAEGWLEAIEAAAAVSSALGLVPSASGYLERARQLRPSDALTLRQALLLNAVEESRESIAASRERCNGALDRFLTEDLRIEDPLRDAQLSFFYLAYHGLCNRELQTKLATLFTRACPSLSWQAPHTLQYRGARERIKVGFISRYLHSHSIGKTTGGLVEKLSRERFEVHVLNVPPIHLDATARRIRASADSYIDVAPSLQEAREQIGSLGLDVLFYQDIGMDPFTYFLAYSRLAPVQCVSFGHPDTTGIPTIDYFVSNDLFELPQAADDYSESLFLLKNLPTLAYYQRPDVSLDGVSRAQFGLSEHETVYLCPQTLFKVHPDFDAMLAGILRRDPRGRVVLIRNHCMLWWRQLSARFARTIPDVAQRISCVQQVSQADFVRLLACADVVLDTLHFNGMNTSLEAFSVGTPVVTLPGALQRGRHTRAMYEKMALDSCIARDAQHYIDIAVGLGTNASQRADASQSIRERSHVLFEDSFVVAEFERFFTTAVADV